MKKNKQKDFEFMDTAAKSLYEVFWDSVREDEIAKRHRIELENIDLKKENEELKHQIAEKDKMIRFYESQLLPEHKVSLTKEFSNFDRKQQTRIRELEIRCQQQEQEIKILAKNQIQNLNHDIEIRHEICEKIRTESDSFGTGVTGQLGYIVTLQLLDQIEGEKEC